MSRFSILLTLLLLSFNSQAQFFEDAVTYLASDELEGRRPGTDGNEKATAYAVEKFKKIGLSPFAGSYKQEFTIFTEMVKTGKNKIETLDGIQDSFFQPITVSLSGDLKNTPLVFAGYGISIPKSDTRLKYDDYENIDVKNKVVLILTGDPAIGNESSKFRHPDYVNYRSMFYKVKNAISKGAKGVLIVNDPLSITGEEPKPFFNAREGGGERFSALAGYATNSWVNTLLKQNQKSTLSLQKQIAKEQKPLSFELDQKINFSVNLKKKTGRVSNVVAVIPGNDPVLNKEVVVIGGHFDHLGLGGESSMDPRHHGVIHNGADDNASGTAMVLKLAKELMKKDLKRTYIFVLFNAEEVGLLGSVHFVEMWARHGKEYGKLFAMLNFDMVGRYNKEVSIMGANSAQQWRELLLPLKSNYTFSIKEESLGSSDHASFTAKQIPSLFFTTGAHEDYHTSTDDADKINFNGMRAIEKYALSLVEQLERTPQLIFNTDYDDGSSSGGSRGYGAHLGCVPEFGQNQDIKGVICTRTSEDSPARKAGILPNDILIQIGEIEIKSIYDLAFALKYYRAGDEIELGWKHEGKVLKKKVTLAKSRRH